MSCSFVENAKTCFRDDNANGGDRLPMSPRGSMKDRNDYEQLPEADCEAISPQDRYPEANPEEAELLGLLDEFIQDSSVTVKLPPATAYDFEGEAKFLDFIYLILCPSLCFMVIAGFALLPTNGELVGPFEYATVLVGISLSVYFIQRMYSKQSKRLFSTSLKEIAIKAVEDVATSVASKVDLVKMKLCDVVIAMRPKLEKASEQEKVLKEMDPTIVVPDPNSVVSELDGAKGEIGESVRLVEEIIPVTPWIPKRLRSPELYQSREINIVLIVSALLHVLGFVGLLTYLDLEYSGKNGTSSVLMDNKLMAKVASALADVMALGKNKADNAALSEDIMTSMSMAWPLPLGVVAEVYVMTIVQLTVVFLRTRISSTVAIVNRMRTLVTEETNQVLRQQGIIFLCQDILEIRMGRVKDKLLKMISLMFKIDMLLKINDDTTPSNSTPNSPSRRQLIGKFFSSP